MKVNYSTRIMKDDNIEIFELNQKSDLMAIQCQCPQCGDKYVYGIPYVQVPCNKCGITYRTDFMQDIYTKKARQLLSKISFKNGLLVKADEKYESSLIHIRQHFIEMHCWDVTEIQRNNEEYSNCQSCGICFNCYTCHDCDTPFKKNINRRKQECPKCKSDKFDKTRFKEIALNEKKEKVCPHCKSGNIKMSRTRNKTMCHVCNSKNLTEKKKNIVFEFTIQRKKAYRRENV